MTIHASGTPLKLSEIAAEFSGNNMGNKRGIGWYLDGTLTTGNFASTNLKFSDFYNKRITDPAGAGSTVITPGSTSWPVPLYRNSITFAAWAGGGGGGDGAGTTVTLPTTTLSCFKGEGFSTGYGGGASGGDQNESGQAFSANGGYNGGNAGGLSYGGGTGGAWPGTNQGSRPGNTPGGGASAYNTSDGSPYPATSYRPGGGGGGFARKTYTPAELPSGTNVPITVGTGGSSGSGIAAGGAGQVNISWT
jgi:hypothetical protein